MIYFGIITGILLMEMLIKRWVKRTERKDNTRMPEWRCIRIEHLENGGAAKGIFSTHRKFLKGMTGVILCGLCLMLGKEHRRIPFSLRGVALAMILGGGLSNWLDRMRKDTVTDYVRFPNCPVKVIQRLVFNISDFFILIGGILLFLVENLSIKKVN